MKALTVSDLSALPVILTLREIAAIYRKSATTIRRGLQNGTFSPRPWDRYPYRWRREDIEADLKKKRDEQNRRNHGFAARPRPAKATVTSAPRRRDPAAS